MPNDNLELALRIRADLKSAISQLKQLNGELDNSSTSAQRAGAAQSTIRGVDVSRSTSGVSRYSSALNTASHSASQLADRNQQLESTNGQLNTQFTELARSVRAYGLALTAGLSAREIISTADAWTNYQNRLRLVTNSQQELKTASDSVFQVAQETSQQLNSTADVYQRFARQQDRLNLSQQQLVNLTRTVNQAVAISGQGVEATDAALVQFGQAMASGVLRGEEFNSVMEQATPLADAIAHGLGVNTGVLKAMAAQGQLTAEQVIAALQKASLYIALRFATRVRTVQQATTELSNEWTRFIGELSNGQGASANLVQVIDHLSSALETMGQNAGNVGSVIQGVLVLGVSRLVTALTGLSAATIRNISEQRARADAYQNVTIAQLGTAEAERVVAARELERARAAVTAAEADVRVAAATAQRTAAEARLAIGLSTQSALEVQATESASALAAAQTRLDTALDARAVASERAAVATTTLTATTNANVVAAERARVANSLFLRSFNGIGAAGGRLLTMMGGPMGLVITAGLMAASFIDFGDDAEKAMSDAKDAVSDLQTPLDQVVENMQKLSDAERVQALVKMNASIQTLTTSAQESARELEQMSHAWSRPRSQGGGPAGPRNIQYSRQTRAMLQSISEEAQKMADGTGGSFDELTDQLKNSSEISESARTTLLDYMASIEKTRREAGQLTDRMKELNDALTGNSDATESVAQANARMQFERINAELDREAERLGKVGDALTVQERLDRITNQLERSKITLSDQQTESIRNRLQQMVAQQRVQSEMNRIYQDSIGLEQNWAATQRAAQRLLDSGVISRTQYNRELTAGQEQYLNQLDPLRQINAQLSNQIRLLHLQPQARQLESRMLSIQNQLLQQGIDLRKDTATRSAVYAKLRQAQALQDVETLRNLNTEYLRMSGDNVGAQTAQLEQQYGELMQRLAADGNAAGQQFMKRFFSLSNAQAQLEQVRTTISNAMSRSDTSGRVLDLQVENGTATELERRQKLLQIHQQTYEVLEKQRPLLEQLSQQPGQVGEAAQQVLANLQIQELQLQQTTSRLTESLKSGLQSGLGDAISGLAKGTDSLADSVRNLVNSIIDSISQLVAQSLTNQFMNSATGTAISTGLTSLFGFASGGYTGAGALNDVAGVVHAGEYVQPQSVMKQPGAMVFQEAFRREGMAAISRFRGYADGGAVTGSNLQMTQPAGSTVENAVNLYAMQDPAAIADMAWGRQGQQNYMVFLGKNKNQIKQILGVK